MIWLIVGKFLLFVVVLILLPRSSSLSYSLSWRHDIETLSALLSRWEGGGHLSSMDSKNNYRKTSSISRTKSQSLNLSCILAQLSSLNPLNPGVKLRMKM